MPSRLLWKSFLLSQTFLPTYGHSCRARVQNNTVSLIEEIHINLCEFDAAHAPPQHIAKWHPPWLIQGERFSVGGRGGGGGAIASGPRGAGIHFGPLPNLAHM